MGSQALTAEDVSRSLSAWIAERFPGTLVAFDEVDPDHAADAVVARLRLHAMTPDIGDTRKAGLRLVYRLSVTGPDPLARHRLISDIAFSMMLAPVLPLADDGACVFELVPVDAAAETAGPVLTLATRLTRQRTPSEVKPVLHPLVLHTTEVGRIGGQILAVDGSPVAGATVEIPSLALQAVSAADGSFRIDGITSDGTALRLVARKRQALASATAKVGSAVTMQLSVKD